MTVSSTVSRWEAVGDGATTSIPVNNKIFAASDLKVYLDGVLKTLDTHYTVTMGPEQDSAPANTVTFLTAPALAAEIIIVREVANTQETDLPLAGQFPSQAVENELDRRTIISQQNVDLFARSLRFPVTDPASLNSEFPAAALRASKLAGFDVDGGVLLLEPTDGSANSVSPSGGTESIFLASYLGERLTLKAFGVTGDGSGADLVRMQNAIDTCAAAGKALYSSPGTFPLSGRLYYRDNSILEFRPDCILARNFAASPAAQPCFSPADLTLVSGGVTNVRLYGIRMTAVDATKTGKTLWINGSDTEVDGFMCDAFFGGQFCVTLTGDRLMFTRFKIEGAGSTLGNDGVHIGEGDDILVRTGVIASGDDMIGIYPLDATVVTIQRVVVSDIVGSSILGRVAAVGLQGAVTGTIRDIDLTDIVGVAGLTAPQGIEVANGSSPFAGSISRVSIKGCRAVGGTTAGLRILDANDVLVDDCKIDSVVAAGFGVNIRSINQTVLRPTLRDSRVLAGNHAVAIDTTGGGEVQSPRIVDNYLAPASTFRGVSGGFTAGVIRDLDVLNNDIAGLSATGVGVRLERTNGMRIEGNRFPGATAGATGFTDSSTNANAIVEKNRLDQVTTPFASLQAGTRVRANPGYISAARGTGSILTGNTSIAITHGLSFTPAAGDILVTPITTWGSATKWWISAYSSTTFTVSCDINPAATFSFTWQATKAS